MAKAAAKKARQGLDGWLKTTGVTFDTGYADKFKKLVISNELAAELQRAYKYVADLNPMEPAGITVGTRSLDDVKKLIRDNSDGIMFSGSLSKLSLDDGALTTIDSGRIGYIIESAGTDSQLKCMMGVIIVNVDSASDQKFKRANKDAEVDALCLLMYWTSDDRQITEKLIQLASDLVFQGRHLGSGSKVFGAKLELINAEEKSREAMAVSGWRKCIFLNDYVDRVESEGRHSDAKSPAERLMKAMAEDCAQIEEWNADTLGRYLQVGRRVAEENVRKWLIIWETTFKRNTLLDGIMLLRACVGVTNDDDELARLLQTLFLDQRCGLKKTLKIKEKCSPAIVFKAYILRARLFVHLRMCFPKFADVVDLYGSDAFYLKEYGIDEYGNFTADHKEVPDDDNPEDSDDNVDTEAGITTYKSRRMLIDLCRALSKHKFERTLIGMAQNSRAAAGGHTLDLTASAAVLLNKQIKDIQQNYDDEFRVAASPTEPQPQVLIHNNSLAVQVDAPPLDEGSYKEKLAEWNLQVDGYVDAALDSFVQSHVALLVDDLSDTDRLKRKAAGLPLLKEKKRKLFLHDDCVASQVNWDKIKRRKMSMFSFMNRSMTADDLDPIKELYVAGKTAGADGQESDDLLMVIVPGPPPNAPGRKNIETVYKVMKGMTPKMQTPKIGKIEIACADILRRTKQHAAFTGSNENHIMFTMQKKGSMHKAAMAHLQGGDVFFNRWPVPSIPWPQLMKVTQAVHEKMFGSENQRAPLTADDSGDDEQATADELMLEHDTVVPFPHEHSMQLGLELIHVFSIDVLITTTVGSGELFKAALQKHKFGIGVCRTAAHKSKVMEKLKAFTKMMNLVSLKELPAKSADMLKYEEGVQQTHTEKR